MQTLKFSPLKCRPLQSATRGGRPPSPPPCRHWLPHAEFGRSRANGVRVQKLGAVGPARPRPVADRLKYVLPTWVTMPNLTASQTVPGYVRKLGPTPNDAQDKNW